MGVGLGNSVKQGRKRYYILDYLSIHANKKDINKWMYKKWLKAQKIRPLEEHYSHCG